MSLTSASSAIKFEASTVMQGRMEQVGDISDVEVDGVTITDTNRGIGLWQRTSFGALRDMRFTNINMTTRTDPKPGFWGAGDPLFVSALGTMPAALIRNISFRSINAVAENGALFSSLPLSQTHAAVHGIELVDVSITIRHTGNVSRPKGKDYSPTRHARGGGTLYPAIVPAFVAGMTFEGVAGAHVVGGGVRFHRDGSRQNEEYWSMDCVNETATSVNAVEFCGGWTRENASGRPVTVAATAGVAG